MALKRAVLCGSEERHPYQLAREALERSPDGGPTHPPIQNPGYGSDTPLTTRFIFHGRCTRAWKKFSLNKGLSKTILSRISAKDTQEMTSLIQIAELPTLVLL